MSIIGQNIRKIREFLAESQTVFAKRLGLNRGQIASYEAGERSSEPNISTILKIVDSFNIDLRSFVTNPAFVYPASPSGNDPTSSDKPPGVASAVNSDWTPARTEIIVATPDVGGNRLVPIVNRKAAASYLSGYQTQEYFEELDAITVPAYLLRGAGQGLVIQAVNDSMEDTIFDGDYLICRLMERSQWLEIPDFSVCVVVTESRGIQVKRIKNRLGRDRLLRLSSDNPRYPSFNVLAGDIHQVWQVVFLLTANLPNRNDTLYRKLDNLEDTTTDLRELYEQLREEVEGLRDRE